MPLAEREIKWLGDTTVAKMTNLERAKQFMPFAALRGFDGVILEKEKIKKDKIELSEYEMELLNALLLRVKKGVLVKVTYFEKDGYITEEGFVSEINFDFKFLKIIKKKISFIDLYKIEIIEEK